MVINETTNNYYYGGTYYEKKPEGGKEVKVGEIPYVKVGETYYQPIEQNGKPMFEVAEVKEDKK